MRMKTLLREFLAFEAAAGIMLIAAAVCAIVIASTPLRPFYEALRELPVAVTIGGFGLSKPLLHWVNDGLMALFFFLVGLEIKREIFRGELSGLRKALLPMLAALGGMVVPAVFYIAIASGHGAAVRGWAIPAATDIAFALGVMALLGSRIPQSLKILMVALAVIDDLGAIVIIAVFYASELSWTSLAVAGVAAAALAALNLSGVKRAAPYILLGIVCWIAVLNSGVHATLAGVVTAMAIPMDGANDRRYGVLENLEHILHPWIAFAVLPLFGFLNAGISLVHLDPATLTAPVTLGAGFGLFIGKQLGVFAAIWLAVVTGLAPKPAGAGWMQIYGISVLAGIGFTMSLFIGELAFESGAYDSELRLGVLGASFASALTGYLVLRYSAREA
jgi:Na+:H+ antiporter, NhaA family